MREWDPSHSGGNCNKPKIELKPGGKSGWVPRCISCWLYFMDVTPDRDLAIVKALKAYLDEHPEVALED